MFSAPGLAQHMQSAHAGVKKSSKFVRAQPNTLNTGTPNMTLRTSLSSHLRPLNMSPHGLTFVHRALHPNDDTMSGGVRIPDGAKSESAALEHRGNYVITKPSVGDQDNTWDVQFMSLPTSDIPLVYRRRFSGTAWGYWYPLQLTGSIQPGQFDQASWLLNHIPPTLLKNTSQFRQSFRGITIVLNANAFSDQGIMTAGEVGDAPKIIELPRDDTADSVKREFMVFNGIPQNENELVAVSPKTCQWEARKGVYMPSRFNQPTHLFQGGEANAIRDNGTGANFGFRENGLPILLAEIGDLPAGGFESFKRSLVWIDSTANSAIATTAGDVNQNVGVIMFSGLDPKATLTMRVRMGMELVPEAASLGSDFIGNAPDKDIVALETVSTVQGRLPLAFEHKYNSLNLLAGIIRPLIRTALPIVAPWLRSVVGKWAEEE